MSRSCTAIFVFAVLFTATTCAHASDFLSEGPYSTEQNDAGVERSDFADFSLFRSDNDSAVFHGFKRRIANDLNDTPGRLFDECVAMANWRNAAILGVGSALSIVAKTEWDDHIRERTFHHENRWGGASDLLGFVGHPLTHVAGTTAIYLGSNYFDFPEARDVSLATFDALLLTDSTVFVMKYMFNTRRPNGEPRGFPSGHVASSFAVAAVVDEFEGPYWGAGAFALAGMVAWQRIDSRKHDLSDVLFGAALGTAIGTTVAREHLFRNQQYDLRIGYEPLSDTTGVQLVYRY